MRIIINHSSMIPIYEQIVDQIKKQINNHTLKENDALPSVRSLAKELQISALTVKKAYDFLENEGLTKRRSTKRDIRLFRKSHSKRKTSWCEL